MKRPDVRGTVGVVLLFAGAIALVGGFGAHAVNAADPDRYVFESDRDHHFDEAEFERHLERTLGRLEDLDVFEDFGAEMEDLGDEIAILVEEILEDGAIRIDGDWPDVIRIDTGTRHDIRVDTRAIARDVQRMARRIERDVVRELERSERVHGLRAWRIQEDLRDREDIEGEMRALQREMRALQRQLERLEEEGDI